MKRPGGVLLLAVACLASLAGRAPVQSSALRVVGLTCEFSTDPLGIDVAAPRLSWRLESNERAQRQKAWRVVVAASREALDRDEGGVWDSGKVASGATTNVAYGGQPLVSSRTYLLEGARLGRRRPAIRLERCSDLDHGSHVPG